MGSPWGGGIIQDKSNFSQGQWAERQSVEGNQDTGQVGMECFSTTGDLSDITACTPGCRALSAWGSLGRESVAG